MSDLRQYVVLLHLRVRHESDGHAYSPEEALKLALEQVKFCPPAFDRTAWVPEAVDDHDNGDGWEVVGRCEACDAWILDGPGRSGHSSSEESGYLCGPCTREAMAEGAK